MAVALLWAGGGPSNLRSSGALQLQNLPWAGWVLLEASPPSRQPCVSARDGPGLSRPVAFSHAGPGSPAVAARVAHSPSTAAPGPAFSSPPCGCTAREGSLCWA